MNDLRFSKIFKKATLMGTLGDEEREQKLKSFYSRFNVFKTQSLSIVILHKKFKAVSSSLGGMENLNKILRFVYC